MTHPSLPQEIPNLPPEVSERIDRLTGLQIRILISKILSELDEVRDDGEDLNRLERELKYWSSEASESCTVENVRATMRIAHEFFGRQDSLGEYSEFANYIAGLMNEKTMKDCAVIMRRFCNCLNQIGLKSEEKREVFFKSFPPSGEYLKCLAGTDERLEEMERNLVDKNEYLPFLNAHNFLMLNCVESIRSDLEEEYHVHIQKYLEQSLGLRAKYFIPGFEYFQSRIPFWKLSVVNRDYAADVFKDSLKRDLAQEIESRRAEIDEVVSGLNKTFEGVYDLKSFDLETDISEDEKTNSSASLSTIISTALQKFQENGTGFITWNEGEKACLNSSLLDRAAFNIPALRFLDTFFENQEFRALSEETSTAEKSEIISRLESNTDNFFTERAAADLITLLRIEDDRPVNYRELFFALENLWMAGENLASNLPIQFFMTVSAILAERPNYFDEIKSKIELILPHQLEKIESIEANYLALSQNPEFLRLGDVSTFKKMFSYNAPIEQIQGLVDSFADVDSLNEALEMSLDFSNKSSIKDYRVICEMLVQRPDCESIFQSIRQKFGEEKVSPIFIRHCLEAAANNNNEDLCKYLFDEFVRNAGVAEFENSQIFHHLARHNNEELLEIFSRYLVEFDCEEYLTQVIKNESPVFVAARFGNLRFIEKMISLVGVEKSGVLRSAPNGMFLTHIAAEYGRANVLVSLASHGIYVFERSVIDGDTPIHLAAYEGHVEVLRELRGMLVRGGVRESDRLRILDLTNDAGFSPLHFAASSRKSNAIRFLCNSGADMRLMTPYGEDALSLALDLRDVASVRELRAAGDDLNRFDEEGKTLIYRLAEKGDQDGIDTLVKAGADINCRNKSKYGENVIHMAVKNNQPGLIPILCHFGADPNLENIQQVSPLDLALIQENTDSVIELGLAGVDLNQRLFSEVCNENTNNVRILVKAGANPNSEILDAGSMLHVIIRRCMEEGSGRNPSIVATLIDLGADSSIRDAEGNAADYLIVREGLTQAVRKIPTERIDHLMREAIEKGDKQTVTKLIFFSENKTITQDVVGDNCLDYLERATSCGSVEIMDLLKAKYQILQTTEVRAEEKTHEEETKVSEAISAGSGLTLSSSAQVSSFSPPAPPSSAPISSDVARLSGPANENLQSKDS
ncbi:MAG: ankyrin repeat domain-containing protein [Proteobacteria bacterium]|nr:ankyrin repeat domain-containing protein [Pseudomonadota bacterium]